MLPNFLIIGAPRAGTTWLEKNLREHPDIFIPEVKEVHFFDRHYERGIDYYESCFAGVGKEKAVGEATPDYMHGAYTERDIPALIKLHLPEVKLIASLRNPIERLYSRFWNSKARFDSNREKSFEQQLMDSPEFIQEGMYADHLERYFELFPREQILILLFDELTADPKGLLRKIYRFLEVDESFESGWEEVQVNQATGKGNLARSKALYQLSRVLTGLRCHRLAGSVRRWNSVELAPMSEMTQARLLELYSEPNARLAKLIGIDLAHWNQPIQP